ncbi:hypothetical protein Pcinc_033397 [Petrolisthes cinctipes]|uniref:Uncharacterized protein n=2 Tax=Petrolisthes cinctipes TaxID=88211 RepID=A0AAE1ESE0_PETCI|nr:hypothetical protein Pcinc_033397 [Petrolisthes cinctipes]
MAKLNRYTQLLHTSPRSTSMGNTPMVVRATNFKNTRVSKMVCSDDSSPNEKPFELELPMDTSVIKVLTDGTHDTVSHRALHANNQRSLEMLLLVCVRKADEDADEDITVMV